MEEKYGSKLGLLYWILPLITHQVREDSNVSKSSGFDVKTPKQI